MYNYTADEFRYYIIQTSWKLDMAQQHSSTAAQGMNILYSCDSSYVNLLLVTSTTICRCKCGR